MRRCAIARRRTSCGWPAGASACCWRRLLQQLRRTAAPRPARPARPTPACDSGDVGADVDAFARPAPATPHAAAPASSSAGEAGGARMQRSSAQRGATSRARDVACRDSASVGNARLDGGHAAVNRRQRPRSGRTRAPHRRAQPPQQSRAPAARATVDDDEERRPADRLAPARRPAARPRPGRPTRTRCSSANCVAREALVAQAHQERDEGRGAHAAASGSRRRSPAAGRRRPASHATSLTKPQSNAGIVRPGSASRPLTASHQKPRLLTICSTPKQHQRAPQPEPQHQRAAEQRAADRQPQPDHLVDDADLGRAVVHRLQQERRHQRAGERVAELVEHDESEKRAGAGLREVAAQPAEQGLELRRAAPPRRPAAA